MAGASVPEPFVVVDWYAARCWEVSADRSCNSNSNGAVKVGSITIPSHSMPVTSILTSHVASSSVSDPFMTVERAMTH